MDLLKLLRDPIWQAIGALLTTLGLIIPLVFSSQFRNWIVESGRKLSDLVTSVLVTYGTQVVLYAIAFVAPVVDTGDLKLAPTFGNHCRIISSLAFLLFVTSLLVEWRTHKLKPYRFTKALLLILVLTYVVPRILSMVEELRPRIPTLFDSLEIYLLVMVLGFAVWQDFRASEKTSQLERRLTENWLKPLWEHQKATTEQLSETGPQFETAQTPRQKLPPQWWQFVEAMKVKKLSFTGTTTSRYDKTVNYYDIIVMCGHQINRDAQILTIIFPSDYADRFYDADRRKIANDIVIEAGRVFEGYAVSWAIQE